MGLKDINISPQACDTGVHSIHDVLLQQPHLIHLHIVVPSLTGRIDRSSRRVDVMKDLGHDDYLAAGDVVLSQKGAKDFFGAAVRICVGDVEGVDAGIVCVLEDGEGFFLVQDQGLPVPGAVRHAADDDLGDFETGAADSVGDVRFCLGVEAVYQEL